MTADVTKDIQLTERQINLYSQRNQPAPRNVVDHLSNLLTIVNGSTGGSFTAVEEAVGTTSDSLSEDTIIGLLKRLNFDSDALPALQNALGEVTDASTVNTVIGLLKRINDSLTNNPYPSDTLISSSPTVNTISSVVLTSDPNRSYALLQNIGSSDIYINFGSIATLTSGFKLPPNSSWNIQISQFITSEFNAIADTSSSILSIFTLS